MLVLQRPENAAVDPALGRAASHDWWQSFPISDRLISRVIAAVPPLPQGPRVVVSSDSVKGQVAAHTGGQVPDAGVLVMAYSTTYFAGGADVRRTAGLLVLFAGSARDAMAKVRALDNHFREYDDVTQPLLFREVWQQPPQGLEAVRQVERTHERGPSHGAPIGARG